MDFTTITLEILKSLKYIAGSYGLAIILLTVIVRVVLWPLGVSQQKSMKKMQTLSPKLKELQNRYKNDPQVMQKKMMEFYKEHKFNPMGGCFPLLLQMPIFIMLYSALISPQFHQLAANSSFLFIDKLNTPMQDRAGADYDGKFNVAKNDKFSAEKTITIYKKDGKTEKVELQNPNNAIEKQGDLVPGKPVDLKIKLDAINLPFSIVDNAKKAVVTVFNYNTKEIENITFNRQDSNLVASVKTADVTKTKFHPDVMVLVILFALTMFLSQKVMSQMTSTPDMDPQQQAMQKQMSMMMPVMITAMFAFFPIPAGVLLYMIVSNVIQVIQTWIINKQIEMEEKNKPQNVASSIPQDLKPAKANKADKKALQTETDN